MYSIYFASLLACFIYMWHIYRNTINGHFFLFKSQILIQSNSLGFQQKYGKHPVRNPINSVSEVLISEGILFHPHWQLKTFRFLNNLFDASLCYRATWWELFVIACKLTEWLNWWWAPIHNLQHWKRKKTNFSLIFPISITHIPWDLIKTLLD